MSNDENNINDTGQSEEPELPGAKENDRDNGSICQKDRIDIWLKTLTLAFTVVVVVFTCKTYNSSQKWKTAEFTFLKFKEFSENKSVILATKLLDYNTARVLFDKDTFYITDDMLEYSLRIDSIDAEFKYPQGKIRDIFDEYLDQLGLFNRYAKTDLITYEEMKPYLIYQLSIIADVNNKRKSNEFRMNLWDYINYYGYSDVKELCVNLGCNMEKK